MPNALDTTTRQKDVGSRKFIVNMRASVGQPPMVRSCEVKQSQFRNRMSFNDAANLRDVFSKDVAIALEECLGKLTLQDTEVVALPSFILEMPGLVLAGAQLVTMRGEDGTFNIIFRFQFFLGGINQVFSPNIGFDDFNHDQNAQTSSSVLADIAMPLLDLCNAAELGLINAGKQMGDFGKSLSEKSQEIKFQIELIKRYVDGLDRFRTEKMIFMREDLMLESQKQIVYAGTNAE
ncbi:MULTISPECIES: hypothetical protein [unclassified Marinovum]